MVTVSVVIPVYNASLYIKRCVDSFLVQTLSDYELILVNDGSSDSSADICDKYASQHVNIQVVHQENRGVSAARQAGLEIVNGKYVIFADPDDWVAPEMLMDLVCDAEEENVDVVICDFLINSSETEVRLLQQMPCNLSADGILRELLLGRLHGSTCNKLYRVETLKKHAITFPDDVNYCEDLWFNCKLFMQSDVRVAYLNKAYYHYDFYSNPLGLSRKFSTKSINDYTRFANFIFNTLDEEIFKHEFEYIKFNTILLAFRSDCNKKVFYSLFPGQMNRMKAQLTKRHLHFVMKYGLYAAMSGFLKMGRSLLYAYDTVYLPVSRLIHGIFR